MSLTASGAGAETLDRTDVRAALLSAVLLVVSLPPTLGHGLVFAALVPFLLRWARRRTGASLRWSVSYGALFFGSFWAINLLWVLRLTRVALWPVPAWAGQVLLLSLLGGLLGAALHGGRNFPLWIVAPLTWAGIEVLRADFLGPLSFPWSPLALALADTPVLLQVGAWVGETGLGIGIVVIASLIAGGLYRSTGLLSSGSSVHDAGAGGSGRRGSGVGRLLLAVALLGAWYSAGQARLSSTLSETVAALVLLQPNISLEAKRNDDAAIPASIAAIEALLSAAVQAGAGEIVLPETALPMDLDSEEGRAVIERWTAQTGRAIWVGGFALTDDGGLLNVLERVPAEPARRVEAEPGDTTTPPFAARWEKVALVPGVERAWGSEYRAGSTDQMPLAAGPALPAGALICIESTHARIAARHARRGARWLINVTNDSWLGEESRLSRTRAFAQHPAHLSLRAVETGLGVVRVGNNGWTGTVSPTGVRTEAIPPHMAGVRAVSVASMAGQTPYLRFGWILRFLTLGPLFLLLVRARTLVVPSEAAFPSPGAAR